MTPYVLTLAVLTLYSGVLVWALWRARLSLRAEWRANTRLILTQQQAQHEQVMRQLQRAGVPPDRVGGRL